MRNGVWGIGCCLWLCLACGTNQGSVHENGGNSAAGGGAANAGAAASSNGGASLAGAGAGAGGSSSAGAPATVAPTMRKAGTRRARLAFARYELRASFDSDQGYPEYDWYCHLSELGGCEFEHCFADAPPGDPPRFIDAGPLTVSNVSNGMSVVLTINAAATSSQDLYVKFDMTAVAPAPGDTIRITAAGSSAVPAFETTLTVPNPVILRLPSGSHSFALASGLRFIWAGSSELVRVAARISAYGFDGSDPSFLYSSYCVFPGTAGDVTLPPAALAEFKCTGAGISYATGIGESQVTSGDYAISVQWIQPDGEPSAFFSDCTP